MARFDMAKDRADRLPDVRAYLENLRPQILELQKKLKLQTQEEIDGLARRDDLDMNEVGRLVELIQAFQKAWKENRIPVTEQRRMEEERVFWAPGPAFEAFERRVRVTIGGARMGNRETLAVIRATALAGEPELAWKWWMTRHEDGFERFWDGPGFALPAVMAIWEGYRAKQVEPPLINADFIKLIESDSTRWQNRLSVDEQGVLRDRLAAQLVRMFARDSQWTAALVTLKSIFSLNLWLETAFSMYRPGLSVTPDLDRLLAEFKEILPTVQSQSTHIAYWSYRGDAAKVTKLYESHKNGPFVRPAAIKAFMRLGNVPKAFEIANEGSDAHTKAFLNGTLAAALVQAGDLGNARRAIGVARTDVSAIATEDIAVLAPALSKQGDHALAIELAESLLSEDRPLPSNRLDALKNILPTFVENGTNPTLLLDALRKAKKAFESPGDSQLYGCAMRELDAAISLRVFKRAARTFMAESGLEKPEAREAWEAKMVDSIAANTDLAEELTYDPPVESR